MRTTREALGAVKKVLLYGGKRYQDPICGRRFRRFRTGPRGRPEAYCPACGSAERHRVLWLYLAGELTKRPGLRVLHIAPERGVGERLRALPDVEYVSADLNPDYAMVTANLTALPFNDGSFDVVVCNHVLEHIPDDIAAMSELRRVIADSGFAVMQHPIDTTRSETVEDWSITAPQDRERIFFQRDHVRIYGRDFADRLRQAKFTSITTIKYQDRLPIEDVERYRLTQLPSRLPSRDIEADVIYHCE